MKQLFQNLKTGEVSLIEVPAPAPRKGHLVIQSTRTLVSPGTERMLSDFGRAGWVGKARQQPERVKQVVEKIRSDGLKPTLKAVFAKLDEPLPLGYCNAGFVRAVGEGVVGFSVGDRVISNGPHAEVVCVPENLCARIPDGVDDTTAVFTVLSAVALNGVRLLEAQVGSRVAVLGLGPLGLLSVQLLKASGCKVIGFDVDEKRAALARTFGAEAFTVSADNDPVKAAFGFSEGFGVDGVLITASTKSNDPIRQAPQMCRKRGKVVLVGVVGLDLSRADFYEKEISFQVACSYGPGRYDPAYEKRGLDYPIGFVRWTEQRNFEAVLELMNEKKVVVKDLVTAALQFEDAARKYSSLLDSSDQLGIVLEYPGSDEAMERTVARAQRPSGGSKEVLGVIGAGAFARAVLMPALIDLGAEIRAISTAGGSSSAKAADKFDVAYNTTDYQEILRDPKIDAVIIATRHNLHARLVVEALETGKHVFVEKPLATTREDLEQIQAVVERHPDLVLAVGFNRRFSPAAIKARELLAGRSSALSAVMIVNAGETAPSSWVNDPEEGGGRIIGEACHFIDLLRFLTGSPIRKVTTSYDDSGQNAVITLSFADGSIGSIHYLVNGHRSVSKERLELFFDGKVLQLDNFRMLRGYGFSRFSSLRTGSQDKGHVAEMESFLRAIKGEAPYSLSLAEILEVSAAAIKAAKVD